MKHIKLPLVLVCGVMAITTAMANAHVLPWRAGELRLKCVGHCARGACSLRADWSESRPHSHAGNRVIFGRIAPGCHSTHVWPRRPIGSFANR